MTKRSSGAPVTSVTVIKANNGFVITGYSGGDYNDEFTVIAVDDMQLATSLATLFSKGVSIA